MAHHPAFAPAHVAVITGAADGIGLAAAKRYAGFGMHVLMADIESERLGVAAEEVRALAAAQGGRVEALVTDVSQFAEVEALKARAYDSFGQVDVLMNNAGTSRPTTAAGELGDWQHIINVNLWGIVHGVQAFTQALVAQQRPALIINTGSKQGITNPPGNPAYNVSKAGVKTLTEALQHELRNTAGNQVSAHLLVPGYTFTGLTRQRVTTKPDGAWWPEQVVDYMLDAIAAGSFYIICPDNEVDSAMDAKRVLWAAGDVAADRPPLSRWHGDYDQAFKDFAP